MRLPISQATTLWHILLTLSTTVVATLLPLSLLFKGELFPFNPEVTFFIPLIFLLDIVISLLLSKDTSGNPLFVKSGLESYLKGWFMVDIIAILPLLLFDHNQFQLLFLCKFPKIISILHSYYLRVLRYTGYLKILFFIYTLSIMIHWLSCGWIALGIMPTDGSTAYIHALYWTVTTLTTVGYGDIKPETELQMIYSMGVMFLGVGMFGYLIGDIVNILSKRDPARNQYRDNISKLSTLLNYCQLPRELEQRIHNYYRYLYQKKSGYDENTLLEGLPRELKQEVTSYLRHDLLEKVPLFHEAPKEFIKEISFQMKPLFYTPNSYVIRAGDLAEEIYFVVQGELDVISADKSRVIAALYSGDFFGEIALFEHIPRTAYVKTKTYCDLYILSKSAFESIVRKYPEIVDTIKEQAYKRHAELSQ